MFALEHIFDEVIQFCFRVSVEGDEQTSSFLDSGAHDLCFDVFVVGDFDTVEIIKFLMLGVVMKFFRFIDNFFGSVF
jgi:hypothetical protein